MENQYEKFAAAVEEQTKERINGILEDARRLAAEITDGAKAAVADEQETASAKNAGRGDDIARRQISSASLAAKKAVLSRRTELESALYSRVREKLAEYTKSGEYRERLVDEITSAEAAGGTFFVSPRDKAVGESLGAKGYDIRTDTGIRLGGWYILFKDKGIIEDHTFDLKFSDVTGRSIG